MMMLGAVGSRVSNLFFNRKNIYKINFGGKNNFGPIDKIEISGMWRNLGQYF